LDELRPRAQELEERVPLLEIREKELSEDLTRMTKMYDESRFLLDNMKKAQMELK
jgi:hypothetical protein